MIWSKAYNKFERTTGSLKFAVIIILSFALCMIVGTFLESWYGTEFAGRVIYKTPLFMGLQALMFLCILSATYLRLPPKKRLYGFYVIHSGLITIGIGSAITYIAGVDGSIALAPNQAAREVILNDDILEISFPGQEKVYSYKLPRSAFESNLDRTLEQLSFHRYLPFADNQLLWAENSRIFPPHYDFSSGKYLIANDQFSQDFILTHHPDAIEYRSSLNLGPLSIHYLPRGLAECFALQENISKYIIWNGITGECSIPEQRGALVQTASTGKHFFVIKEKTGDEEILLSFFPDHAPWPLDSDLKPMKDSPIKVFNKSMFEDRPNLFLFGESLAYYLKDEKRWEVKPFSPTNKIIELPWMGFRLSLEKYHQSKYPKMVPSYVTPIQKNSQLVSGTIKAIEVQADGIRYWATNERPLTLMINAQKVIVSIKKETLKLPFELVLSRFKMDKDPGTNQPASYESFVTLFTGKGPEQAHIYMNNPLKFSGFTFYQASYWQDPESGEYGSSLSVNVDQGRPLKYLGSLFLVFGSIWHFGINKRKKKKKS